MDPNMLSLGEATLFPNDFQRYLQDNDDENPRNYLEDGENIEDFSFLEDEPHDDTNQRVVVAGPRRPSQYFGSSEDEEESTSSDEDRATSINGVPMNSTGPRTPSHNEIHEKVTHCLKSSKNLLVECPAVLDRRFKILTGVLDYFQWKKGNAAGSSTDPERESAPTPLIIYFAVPSFAQSHAVMKEIKDHFSSSGHLSGMKISILDHRKNLCNNEEINSAEGKVIDCSCIQFSKNSNYIVHNASRDIKVVPRPTCGYYSNTYRPREQLFSFFDENEEFNTVLDIEDFISNGQLTSQCPYYDSKQIHREADLVICPQEFIISPLLRQEYNISLDNSIIIFDEGFDIESVCYEEGSIIVSIPELNIFSRIFGSLVEQNIQVRPEFADLIRSLSNAIAEFSLWMQEEVDNNPEPREIIEAFRVHDLNSDYAVIENFITALGDIQTHPTITIPTPEHMPTLRKFLHVITLALLNTKDYFLKVTRMQPAQGRRDAVPSLQILLTNPGLLFIPVGGPAVSVIVGASCLAPFKTFDDEFGITFHEKVKIEQDDEDIHSGHLFAYCSEGPTDMTFKLNYASRGDPRVINEIGEAIIRICEKLPGGIIVCFHTDTFFKKVLKDWRTPPSDILTRLQILKHVFSELDMTTPERTESLISNFKERSRSSASQSSPQNGALLFVLRRGTVFQRLESFLGAEKRAIIHVSIPYGAWYLDRLVMAKRFLFEERHGMENPQENHDWYESEAFRKLNQSFNYSVHDKEWGIVVVLDNRMHSRRYEFPNLVPTWVKNRFRRQKFPQLMEAITKLVQSQERNE